MRNSLTRVLIVVVLVAIFASPAAAGTWDFPDQSVSYGGSTYIDVTCTEDGSNSCLINSPEIEVCGETLDAQRNTGTNGVLYRAKAGGDTSLGVPSEVECDLGDNSPITMRSDGSYVASGGSLFVHFTTQTNNLKVRMNVEGLISNPDDADGNLLTFSAKDISGLEPGKVKVVEEDIGPNDKKFYDTDMNVVLDWGDESTDLDDLLAIDLIAECDNDPCRVAKTEFTNDNNVVNVDNCKSSSTTENCLIGYSQGNVDYNPKNELVVGQSYGEGGPPSSVSTKTFHICTDLPGIIGKTVYSPGDNHEFDQFRCTEFGEWENVALCGDGVDNDGDGATDLNDPNCDTTSGTTESASICNPRVGRLADDYYHPDLEIAFNEGRKVAFNGNTNTDFVDSISGCGYSDFEPYVEYKFESPELFRCNDDGEIEGYSSSDSEDGGDAVDYWGAKSYCSGLQDIVTSSNWDTHNGKIPVVEYFVEREDIPTGENKYATSLGFKNKFYDDLSGAELYNYQSVDVDCSNDPNFATMYGCTTTRHNNDSYEPLNMTDLSDGYKSGEYMDSWTFANGAANNGDISSSSYGTVESDSVFSGGFAGKCKEGQSWKYVYRDDKWRCSGAVQWNQSVVVPDYTPKETPQTVGIYITPHNFQEADTLQIIGIDTLNSFSEAFSNANNEDVNLRSVTAVCWVGDVNNKPAFEDANEGTTWFDTKVSGLENRPDKPVPLFGQLDLTGNSYTCSWGYDASNSKFYSSIGGPADIIESSSDERLEDDWFGDGISKSGFNSVSSADAKNQFNTWMDQNAATGRSDPSSYYYDSDHLALN